MNDWKNCIALSCFIGASLIAAAQTAPSQPPPANPTPSTEPARDRRPGLYELTLVTTTVSPTASTYPPRTRQVCLTQEMIDKYGAMVPDNMTRACKLASVVKKPGGMTADIVCAGAIAGKGTLEVNWSDSEHAKGNLHFSGTMQPGENIIKIEWSATTDSVYKGPDCGALKPVAP